MRTVLDQPVEHVVDVLHREHHPEVAQGVHRGIPMIGDDLRRGFSRHQGKAVRSSTMWLTMTPAHRRFVLNQSVEEGRPAVDDQLSRAFAALSDPTRRDIVARLAARDATVGELAEPYDVSVQAVSKHVKVLAEAGLVTQRRDAQRRPCHLEAEVFDLMTKWIERYRQQAEARYQRLDAVLAEMRGDEQANQSGTSQQGAAS